MSFIREKDIFHQISFHKIQHNSSKLRTYAELETKIGMETYLVNIQNTEERTQMSKFRLSNHRLMVETGRHLTTLIATIDFAHFASLL